MAAGPALQVLLHDRPVAELRGGRSLTLTYLPDVVDELGVGAVCLSLALPVAVRPYRDPASGLARPVEAWCEGLLPEGETRTVLERRFGVRRGDTLGLLTAIGQDCAGAVSFHTGDELERHPAPAPLDEVALAAAVESLPTRPLGVDDDTRASLGGMQAKLLLAQDTTGWSRPVAGRPSTHLLKPDPVGLRRPGLVAAEALTLRAARLAGIDAAGVELVTVGERLAVVVERYDRARDVTGAVRRIHQEDGCQALGLDPARSKYQSSDAPPSYSSLARLLRTHARDIDRELTRLGQQLTLSWAVGNTDGHARNLSVLLTDGVAALAPAYDVAPTHLFVSGTTSALWIGGQADLRWITRGHLLREMQGWGVAAARARDVVESTLAALVPALHAAAEELGPLVDPELVALTVEHVQRMAAA